MDSGNNMYNSSVKGPRIDGLNSKPVFDSGNGSGKAFVLIFVFMMFGLMMFGSVMFFMKSMKEDIFENTDCIYEMSETETETDAKTVNSEDYIYIGEWGIKVKIPEGLEKVSYLVDYRESEPNENYLYINGVTGDYDAIPTFLNTSTEEYWLGALHRLVAGEKPVLEVDMGALVTTIDGFEYYYGHPQALMSDNEQDRDLESKTIDLIQEMLTNPENYSKI